MWYIVEIVIVDVLGFVVVIGVFLIYVWVNVVLMSRLLLFLVVLLMIFDLLLIGGCVFRNFFWFFYFNFEVERWRFDYGVFSVYCVEMECVKLVLYFLVRLVVGCFFFII